MLIAVFPQFFLKPNIYICGLNKTLRFIMRTFLLMTILFLFFHMSAQDILWEKSYGGKHAEYLLDAQPTADYGFILAGSSLSEKGGNKIGNNLGDLDYWVWKMDEHGEPDWQKSIGGNGTDILYSIHNTRDGGFILAGTSNSNESEQKKGNCRGEEDLWVLKIDAKGNEMWQCTLGGTGREIIKSIAQTNDGGYILGGSSASGISQAILGGGTDKYGKTDRNRGNMDYWVIKLDDKGEIKWQRTLGGIYVDVLESVEHTRDGGYILVGYSNSPGSEDKIHDGYGEGDFWLVKLNKEGQTEWQKVLGGAGDDHPQVILQTKDGGYIVGGNSASETSGNKSKTNQKGIDLWVVRIDEYGDILWQETYNTGETDILRSLVQNQDGSFLIGGYTQSEVMGKKKTDVKDINDYIALKIDAEGKEIWKESVGSKGEDILQELIETRDGGYLLAGTSKGEISRDRNSGQGKNDFWAVKIKDMKKPEEKRLKLEAIPNPALEYTNIIVGFDFDSGTLSLFDLGGRLLQSFSVDNRTIPLHMASYPEGIYIVEVSTNKGTESVKVMKAKK